MSNKYQRRLKIDKMMNENLKYAEMRDVVWDFMHSIINNHALSTPMSVDARTKKGKELKTSIEELRTRAAEFAYLASEVAKLAK